MVKDVKREQTRNGEREITSCTFYFKKTDIKKSRIPPIIVELPFSIGDRFYVGDETCVIERYDNKPMLMVFSKPKNAEARAYPFNIGHLKSAKFRDYDVYEGSDS